jgi:hypothetical protein
VSARDDTLQSRRRFLLICAGGFSAVGGLAAWQRWNALGQVRDIPVSESSAPADSRTIETVAHFAGAMFGVLLSADDLADLRARLTFAADSTGRWAEEYAWLAKHVDGAARDIDARSFIDAEPAARDTVMRAAIARDLDRRTQKIRAFFHAEGQAVLRMRRSTVPHLAWLYQNSSVPWRHRGYTSWPGVPDDRLAYTRPGGKGRC